jgi:hypothetical protein
MKFWYRISAAPSVMISAIEYRGLHLHGRRLRRIRELIVWRGLQ